MEKSRRNDTLDESSSGNNMIQTSCNPVIPDGRSGARRARQTPADCDFDGQSTLRDAIAALLALALPADRHEMITRLTGIVCACRGVAEHRDKVWGDLTEAEGSIVAHKVGALAREILGTGRARDESVAVRDRAHARLASH
jgi:hypothetical protein